MKLCLLGAQVNRTETKGFKGFQHGEINMILTSPFADLCHMGHYYNHILAPFTSPVFLYVFGLANPQLFL